MSRLIGKFDVELFNRDIVYLETKTGGGLVMIVGFSYWRDKYGAEGVDSVKFAEININGEYVNRELDIADYGVTWRLWDVAVEIPGKDRMQEEAWDE